MALGETWWHGALVTRQDSYGPEAPVFRRKQDDGACDAWEAWDYARHKLTREANALLRGAVSAEPVRFDRRLREVIAPVEPVAPPAAQVVDEDLLLLALVLIAMS